MEKSLQGTSVMFMELSVAAFEVRSRPESDDEWVWREVEKLSSPGRVLFSAESSIEVCRPLVMDLSVGDDNDSVEEGLITIGVDDSSSSCTLDVSEQILSISQYLKHNLKQNFTHNLTGIYLCWKFSLICKLCSPKHTVCFGHQYRVEFENIKEWRIT